MNIVLQGEDLEIVNKIIERAENMNLLGSDRVSLLMDINIAHKTFNLRLNDFLEADDFNFSHDIVGIQNHVNRESKTMEDFFLPRFAGNQGDN